MPFSPRQRQRVLFSLVAALFIDAEEMERLESAEEWLGRPLTPCDRVAGRRSARQRLRRWITGHRDEFIEQFVLAIGDETAEVAEAILRGLEELPEWTLESLGE
ncbi:MAG: hypothetical protein DMD80_13930 [Candidatus Rokuibacteriota bacterium]|nr:MAG: hypothetical protein DMD80_13930 [Candidatus Rokubacteria bacterium]